MYCEGILSHQYYIFTYVFVFLEAYTTKYEKLDAKNEFNFYIDIRERVQYYSTK